jgi:hypothetical protein
MSRIQDTWSQLEDPAYVHARNVVCSRNLLDVLISIHGRADDIRPPIDLTPPMVEKAAAKHAPPPVIPHKNIEPYWWPTMWFGDLIDLTAPLPGEPITIAHIQNVVAKSFDMTRADLMGNRRTHKHIMPRHIAMYLCKEMTKHSLPEIGRRFGGRDHTTALYAVQKIAARCVSDPALAIEIAALKAEIAP